MCDSVGVDVADVGFRCLPPILSIDADDADDASLAATERSDALVPAGVEWHAAAAAADAP